MQVVENDHIVCFDVDDTLIMWIWDQYEKQQLDETDNLIPITHKGFSVLVKPHKVHIELLQNYKAKGKFIIVWSQSGFSWAQAVIEALELEDYVDLVLTKPQKYVDDLHADEWMEHTYKEDK